MELHEDVEDWLLALAEEDPESADLVEAAIDMLAQVGPQLGRPLVDRIQGSQIHHMKELRPASSGRSEVRILFAFDPRRCALLLVAGDKQGQWNRWYEDAIEIAEKRYKDHLTALEVDGDG
ncbi:type II toxin-antitoxin system RelE/ParE family toxin [Amycolatopsis sulphurea]|uniref:type II toxin-antitoxin system RelE/ParE family toxin n=1 Tax=Amycolatopsis sulphurea TaxID=76022 RepID=UPI003C2B1838